MTLPVEIVVLALTANGAFLTLCAHLLIGINNKLGSMATAHAVERAEMRSDIAALKRESREFQN